MARTWSSFPAVPALLLLAVAGVVLYIIKKRSESSDSSSSSTAAAAATTGEDSSSSSSSSTTVAATTRPLPAAEYEVFLSFRGTDVRTNFADFLREFLDHSKIRTFFDDVKLPKGENLDAALVKAIKESKIYIPILSSDYATSKWCLKELALMVKCWKKGNGNVILPIFYKMSPKAVRHQDGSYKDAFEILEKKHNAETIKEWKEALKLVGEMKGWSIKESDGQGAIIAKVFTDVWSHLTRDYMLVTDKLIGVGSYVGKVKELLRLGCEGVKVVGITGMGGIGKTTIAKALCNEVSGQFQKHYFVENVRETLSMTGGTLTLQKQIIHGILPGDCKVIDTNSGLNILRNRICTQKVLIILDDADYRFKFDKILGNLEDFLTGSRFIITSRDKRVIETFEHHDLYEAEEMDEDDSLQLFSRHAFGMNHPPQEDIALSKEFVKAAAGIPLTLKVIGSLLFRSDKILWDATLNRLKDILPSEVEETLRISYLALTHEEKQVFLDIACFFIGEVKEGPLYMWNSCDFHAEVVITTLIQRSLIKLNRKSNKKEANERNIFWMHDHIRDLGRTIIREEDFQCPWNRSRIWSNEDALDMLTYEKDACKLKAMRLWHCSDLRKAPDLSGCKDLELLNFDLCPDISGQLHVSNLKNLLVLKLVDTKITELTGDIGMLQKLQEIHVENSKLSKLPVGIGSLSSLTSLQVSSRRHFKHESTLPASLKWLHLSSPRVSNLLDLKNLEELWLDDCEHQFAGNIWNLSKLKFLKLSNFCCESLLAEEEVGDGMGAPWGLPSSLDKLEIHDSKNLERLPNLANLNNLTKLVLEYTGVREIVGMNGLRMLEILEIKGAPNLKNLDGVEHLKLLQELSVRHCSRLANLPGLRNLTKLRKLIIYDCQLFSQVTEIEDLEELIEVMIDERLIIPQLRSQVQVTRM